MDKEDGVSMPTQPTSKNSQNKRSNPVRPRVPADAPDVDFKNVDYNDHYERVIEELRLLGASWYGQSMMEARYLPQIIHPDEHLEGVVYGWQPIGIVMMVATDRRVLFIDKKPLYARDDEISYISVRGVSHAYKLFFITVILHTQVDDFVVNTFNQKATQIFAKAIQRHSLEYNQL